MAPVTLMAAGNHGTPAGREEAEQLARLFLPVSRYNYYYTRSKLRADPLYPGVWEELRGRALPLLDVGCGMGVLGFFLRGRGWQRAYTGIDFDRRKIVDGQKVNTTAFDQASQLKLEVGDARTPLPAHSGDVTILDVLQFLTEAQQRDLLRLLAERVAPGGKLIIRSGLRDDSKRFRITRRMDWVAKLTFWMKAAPVHYPTMDFLLATLAGCGMQGDYRPLWGKTPFNNYLLVFTASSADSKQCGQRPDQPC